MPSITPKVSVIIPTYNSELCLEACLTSVCNQTFRNIEIIIIDGKSTDGTLAIIDMYKEHIANWVSEPDKGIYDAMNKGIDRATGEWLYFMGSDDILYNKQVFECVFTQVNNNQYDVIYGNVLFKHAKKVYDGKFTSYKLLQKNICHQSMFTSKRLLLAKGKFNIKYKLLADYEFNMNWFNDKQIKRKYVDVIIAIYNEDGISFNVTDEAFCRDKPLIINKYFSLIDRLHLQYDYYLNKSLKRYRINRVKKFNF